MTLEPVLLVLAVRLKTNHGEFACGKSAFVWATVASCVAIADVLRFERESLRVADEVRTLERLCPIVPPQFRTVTTAGMCGFRTEQLLELFVNAY